MTSQPVCKVCGCPYRHPHMGCPACEEFMWSDELSEAARHVFITRDDILPEHWKEEGQHQPQWEKYLGVAGYAVMLMAQQHEAVGFRLGGNRKRRDGDRRKN